MGDSRQDVAFEIGDDVGEIFAPFRTGVREASGNFTRLDLRLHRVAFAVVQILGDPIDQGIAMLAKIIRVHMELWFGRRW